MHQHNSKYSNIPQCILTYRNLPIHTTNILQIVSMTTLWLCSQERQNKHNKHLMSSRAWRDPSPTFLKKKSSSRLVQKTKFHNLLNAATKPETPPKDQNIPWRSTNDRPGIIYWDRQGMMSSNVLLKCLAIEEEKIKIVC